MKRTKDDDDDDDNLTLFIKTKKIKEMMLNLMRIHKNP